MWRLWQGLSIAFVVERLRAYATALNDAHSAETAAMIALRRERLSLKMLMHGRCEGSLAGPDARQQDGLSSQVTGTGRSRQFTDTIAGYLEDVR